MRYGAPEVYIPPHRGGIPSNDVWAMGVTLFQLLGPNAYFELISSGRVTKLTHQTCHTLYRVESSVRSDCRSPTYLKQGNLRHSGHSETRNPSERLFACLGQNHELCTQPFRLLYMSFPDYITLSTGMKRLGLLPVLLSPIGSFLLGVRFRDSFLQILLNFAEDSY